MPSARRPSLLRRTSLVATLALGLVGLLMPSPASAAAAATEQQQPSLFGTLPFADDRFQGPQAVPGKVQLAYYDLGGPDVAYHSYASQNFGSCSLNPCDGQYKNVFRKDDGASTSYTKPPNGGWPGDRFYANNSQVPVDQIYWGWNAIGNWARVSLLVKEAGNYTASVFGTCNSGGQLTLTVDDYAKAGAAESVVAKVPATGSYHLWALFPNVATVPFEKAGLAVLTVNVTGIDDFKEGSQFGNVLYVDLQKQ